MGDATNPKQPKDPMDPKEPIDPKKVSYDKLMNDFLAMPVEDRAAIAEMMYSKQVQGAGSIEFKQLSMEKLLAACSVKLDFIEDKVKEVEEDYEKKKDEKPGSKQESEYQLLLAKAKGLAQCVRDVLEVTRRYGLPWAMSEDQIRDSFNVRYIMPDAPPAVEAFFLTVAKIKDEGPKIEARIGKEVAKRTSAFMETIKLSLSNLQGADRAALAMRLAGAVTKCIKLEEEYGKRLTSTEEELKRASLGLNDEKRLTRRLEDEKKAVEGERDAANDAKQQTESTLATRVRELAASIAAKEIAENNFADLKPRFEKLGREYSELQTKFAAAFAEAADLGAENVELYRQIEDFVKSVSGFTAALGVEQKRADDLEKKLKEAEKKLSKSQLRVRSGWYATAASLVIGIAGFVGWSQSERPIQIVQQSTQPPVTTTQPPITTTQPPLIPQPKPETISYLMGAYLLEVDNQLVVSSRKDADLEKRAKNVSYLSGAYLVEFEDKQFALTADKKSVVDQQLSSEKAKLGRDLTVVEKKALYEKTAIKYVR